MLTKEEIKDALKEEPKTPPLTELDKLRASIVEMEAQMKSDLDSGTATPQKQLSDRQVLEQKHFQLRKTLFRTQIGGEFTVFENAIVIEKQKKFPPSMDTSKLPLAVEIIERVKKASEEVKPMLESVDTSNAIIESIKAKNLKIDSDILTMVNDLKSQKVLNNDSIAREEREKKRLLGSIAEVYPIWVAFEYPAIFNEVCGETVLSSAAIATTPTTSVTGTPSDKTVGSKPSDLTPEEHKAMLNALKGEAGKQAVQQAIAEGAKSSGNKEIFDKISQKVLGKTFAHIGSLDSSIYNIRGYLGLRD